MSQLDVSIPFPSAPPCPSWCDGHDMSEAKDGWPNVEPAGVSKICEHTVRDWDEAIPHIDIRVQRWAALTWPTILDGERQRWADPAGLSVELEPVVVRVNHEDDATSAEAERIADLFRVAAEIVAAENVSTAEVGR